MNKFVGSAGIFFEWNLKNFSLNAHIAFKQIAIICYNPRVKVHEKEIYYRVMSVSGKCNKLSVAYACDSWLDAFIFTIENYGKRDYKIDKIQLGKEVYDESKT